MIDNRTLSGEQQHQEDKDQFDGYRKTCNRVFSRAGQSQLKYLQSFLELQQSMLISCESITAKQISWFEAFAKNFDGNSRALTAYSLGLFSSSVEGYLTALSLAYDSGVLRLDYYKKYFEIMNQGFLTTNSLQQAENV